MSDDAARSSLASDLATALKSLNALRPSLGDAAVDQAIAALRQRSAPPGEQPGRADELRLRQVSILFCDIVDSTQTLQGLDTEDALEVVGTALRRFAALIEAAGGRVLRYAGDGLKAAFGSEQTREDDAQRAVAAGLDLLAAAAEHAQTLQRSLGVTRFAVRVGINTGDVLLGGGAEANNSAMGHAVHVAARLEHAAPPGQLLIGERTWSLVRGSFDVQRQSPLSVKGVDSPLENFIVLGAKPGGFRRAGRGIEGVTTRLVGRDAQLLALQEALAHSNRPGAGLHRVLVIGEAGVGKSRLLDEFERWGEAAHGTWGPLRAYATPQTPGQPYALLRQLLCAQLRLPDSGSLHEARHTFEGGLLPLMAPQWDDDAKRMHVHSLGQLIGLDYTGSTHLSGVDARQLRHIGFRAAGQALRHAAAAGAPLLLLLDDIHWADQGSLDFLDYLLDANADVPALMLALARPVLLEQRPAWGEGPRQIRLEPLDEDDSERLTRALLERLRDAPKALLTLVTGRAEGNPFFMEELITMLIGQGAIDIAGEQWSVDEDRLRTFRVPATLTGVLQARLDGLPAVEREALQLSSVIGLRFWDAALAHVQPRAETQLGPLARRELVFVPDDANPPAEAMREYAFRHQLLHQVTYDTVLKPVKRRAHASAADWLARYASERGKHLLASAAEHYERAGDRIRAIEFHAQAAEHMRGNYVNHLAIEHATRALDLITDDMPNALAQRWRLLDIRERVHDLLGRRTEQLADIEAVVAMAEQFPPDDVRHAQAALRRGLFAQSTGDWPTVEREMRRGMTLAAQAGDETILLHCQSGVSKALCVLGRLAEAEQLGLSGLARARSLADSENQAHFCIALVILSLVKGDAMGVLTYNLENLEANRQRNARHMVASSLGNVGGAYTRFGALGQARAYLAQALEQARAIDYKAIEGATLLNLSTLAWCEGDYAKARAYALQGIELQRTARSRMHMMYSHLMHGRAELGLGRFDEATQAFLRSQAIARDVRHRPGVIDALQCLAQAAFAGGDQARARQWADELMREAVAGSKPEQQNLFAGSQDHLIRLTLYRIWSADGDPRAAPMLAEAHAMVMAEAARITDLALRESFLTNLAETREIIATWGKARAA